MLRRVARGGRFARKLSGQPESPFAIRDGGRPLRLVLDLTTLTDGEPLELLQSFSHHPRIEVVEYRGETFDAKERLAFEEGPPVAELLLNSDIERNLMTLKVRGGGKGIRAVVGEPRVISQLAATGSHPQGPAEAGLGLCWATDSLGYDALVTGNTAVLGGLHEHFVREGNPITDSDACWLLGLYLRTYDDYTLDIGKDFSFTSNRSDFFFHLSRELLPAAWRWFSGCVGAWDADRTSDLVGLGMGALERYDRALRARDRVLVCRQLGDDIDNVEEEILAFDVELLMLSAVLDVTAMVAHRAYALPLPDLAVGWQRSKWREQLGLADPGLFALTETGTAVRDAITAVAHMRNMVHAEPLRAERSSRRWPRRHQVRVPDSRAASLIETARRQGGLEAFGLEEVAGPRGLPGTGLFVDPGIYGERVLTLATDAINQLMDATDVQRIARGRPLLAGPPDNDQLRGQAWERRRVRLMAGL